MPFPVGQECFSTKIIDSSVNHILCSGSSPEIEMRVWKKTEAFFSSQQALECITAICHPPAGTTREMVVDIFNQLRSFAHEGFEINVQSGRHGENHFCILDKNSREMLSVTLDDAGNYTVEVECEGYYKTHRLIPKQVGICDLPMELKQEIAFNLDSISYGHLRETSHIMNESLDGFSVMMSKIKAGATKEKMQALIIDKLDKKIRKLLDEDKGQEIILSLKNCYVRPSPYNENSTIVGTEYLPDKHTVRSDRIREAFESGIPISSSSYRIFNPAKYHNDLWMVEITFSTKDINKESLDYIFSSFNNKYKNTKGPERFVVANAASKLLSYWKEKTPSLVNNNDLNYISNAFPELFLAGQVAAKIISKPNK